MPIFSETTEIFHGTPNAFNRILMPHELDEEILRHGRDEYGIGFYGATNPSNPTEAQSYAKSYARSNGLLLNGTAKEGTYSLLNMQEPLGEETAARLQQGFRNTNSGNPLLDKYYSSLADKITPEMSGEKLWNRATSSLSYKGFHDSQFETKVDRDAFEDGIHNSGRSIYKRIGSLEGVPSTAPLGEEATSKVQDILRNAGSANPHVNLYYNDLADRITPQTTWEELETSIFASRSSRARVESILKNNIPEVDTEAMDKAMDDHVTKVLNNADIDGLYLPDHQTVVFKGTGIEKLPDLYVKKIVGAGPQNTLEPITEGQLMVPSRSQITIASQSNDTLEGTKKTAPEAQCTPARTSPDPTVTPPADKAPEVQKVPAAGAESTVAEAGANNVAGEAAKILHDAGKAATVLRESGLTKTLKAVPYVGAALTTFTLASSAAEAKEMEDKGDTSRRNAVIADAAVNVVLPVPVLALYDAKQIEDRKAAVPTTDVQALKDSVAVGQKTNDATLNKLAALKDMQQRGVKDVTISTQDGSILREGTRSQMQQIFMQMGSTPPLEIPISVDKLQDSLAREYLAKGNSIDNAKQAFASPAPDIQIRKAPAPEVDHSMASVVDLPHPMAAFVKPGDHDAAKACVTGTKCDDVQPSAPSPTVAVTMSKQINTPTGPN